MKNSLHTLISIIERIEKGRIQRMNQLQELKVGTAVSYQQRIGKVIEVSPKQTSVIVEFVDHTRKRFFMNKRKNTESIESLSLCKVMEEVENK